MPTTPPWRESIDEYSLFARHLVRYLWPADGRRPRTPQELIQLIDPVANKRRRLEDGTVHKPLLTEKRLWMWIHHDQILPPPGLTLSLAARIAKALGVPAHQLLLDAGLADPQHLWVLATDIPTLPTAFTQAGMWERTCAEVARRARRANWSEPAIAEMVQRLETLMALGEEGGAPECVDPIPTTTPAAEVARPSPAMAAVPPSTS